MSYFDNRVVQTAGIYSATFAGVAVTLAQDAFAIVAPAGRRVGLRALYLNQLTDFGPNEAEILSVRMIRGNIVPGSGGGAFVPLKLRPWFPDAGSSVRINDTTIASGGIEEVLIADGWNVAAGWIHAPALDDERLWIEPGQMLCCRIGAPADSLSCNGTAIFEEVSA